MVQTFGASAMWKKIEDDLSISGHDRPLSQDILFRLTNYNPLTHGTLFLKNNIFYAVERLCANTMSALERIDHLGVNRPMSVLPSIHYKGMSITVDRICSAEEVVFLAPIS